MRRHTARCSASLVELEPRHPNVEHDSRTCPYAIVASWAGVGGRPFFPPAASVRFWRFCPVDAAPPRAFILRDVHRMVLGNRSPAASVACLASDLTGSRLEA